MTFENCEKLLKHYEEVGNEAAAKDMREHMAKYRPSAPKTSGKDKK